MNRRVFLTTATVLPAALRALDGQSDVESALGGRGRNYEIQQHDVEGADYATGSLYSFKPAIYLRIELQAHDPGRWIECKEIKIRRL